MNKGSHRDMLLFIGVFVAAFVVVCCIIGFISFREKGPDLLRMKETVSALPSSVTAQELEEEGFIDLTGVYTGPNEAVEQFRNGQRLVLNGFTQGKDGLVIELYSFLDDAQLCVERYFVEQQRWEHPNRTFTVRWHEETGSDDLVEVWLYSQQPANQDSIPSWTNHRLYRYIPAKNMGAVDDTVHSDAEMPSFPVVGSTPSIIAQDPPKPVDFGIDFKAYEASLSTRSYADLSNYFPILEDGESFLVGCAPSEGEKWAGQETTLDRFRKETESMAMYAEPPKISSFALCDMDQDGEQELVLAFDNAAGTFLILHRNGNGFQGVIQYAREFQALQTNGIYTSAGGAAISEYQRMTFENGNVQITTLAYAEDVPGEETFLIGEKEVTRSEYDDWVNENSPGEVTWEV